MFTERNSGNGELRVKTPEWALDLKRTRAMAGKDLYSVAFYHVAQVYGFEEMADVLGISLTEVLDTVHHGREVLDRKESGGDDLVV